MLANRHDGVAATVATATLLTLLAPVVEFLDEILFSGAGFLSCEDNETRGIWPQIAF